MPTRLDAEGLHKAATALPPAIEVNAIDDAQSKAACKRISGRARSAAATRLKLPAKALGRRAGQREGRGEDHPLQTQE
jgi:hypothetical protein